MCNCFVTPNTAKCATLFITDFKWLVFKISTPKSQTHNMTFCSHSSKKEKQRSNILKMQLIFQLHLISNCGDQGQKPGQGWSSFPSIHTAWFPRKNYVIPWKIIQLVSYVIWKPVTYHCYQTLDFLMWSYWAERSNCEMKPGLTWSPCRQQW